MNQSSAFVKNGFVLGGYSPRILGYEKCGIFIHCKTQLPHQVQNLFSCDNLGPSERIRNSVVLVVSDGEQVSTLCITKMVLLFPADTLTDVSEIVYEFYSKCSAHRQLMRWIKSSSVFSGVEYYRREGSQNSCRAGTKLQNETRCGCVA